MEQTNHEHQAYWMATYDQFLEQSIQDNQLKILPDDAERRANPRFQLCHNIIWATGEFNFSIVDISVSGLAFDSSHWHDPGRKIALKFGDLVSVQTSVLNCMEMESTPLFYMKRFRVQCRFEDELQGMKFLVIAKDMREIQIEAQ